MSDVLSFLNFSDWIIEQGRSGNSWTVIALSEENNHNDLFTYSAMAVLAEGTIDNLLAGPNWEIRHSSFGHPEVQGYDTEPLPIHHPHTVSGSGIKFLPLVIYRESRRLPIPQFELSQDFLLYHNAVFVPNTTDFRFIDDDGEDRSLPVFMVTASTISGWRYRPTYCATISL